MSLINCPEYIDGHKTNFVMDPERRKLLTELGLRFVVRRVDIPTTYDIGAFTDPSDAISYCRHVFRNDYGPASIFESELADLDDYPYTMYGVIFTDTGDTVFLIGDHGEARDMTPADMDMGDSPDEYVDWEMIKGWD